MLESQLQSETRLTLTGRAGDFVVAVQLSDDSVTADGRRDRRAGIAELWRVGDAEHLPTELQAESLSDSERAEDAAIQIEHARPTEDVAAGRAEAEPRGQARAEARRQT